MSYRPAFRTRESAQLAASTSRSAGSMPAPRDNRSDASAPPGRKPPVRVHIVADHRMFVEAMELLLRAEADLAVAGTVQTEEEALARCSAEPPDVVLLDIDRPGMDPAKVRSEERRVGKECGMRCPWSN